LQFGKGIKKYWHRYWIWIIKPQKKTFFIWQQLYFFLEIMKTNILHTALLAIFSFGSMMAQDVTTVRANSTDISDNLDLKAVASIFGDSRDLEDFERRLNDPQTMISNLDLNGDNRVDYLRVVELSESNTHVIVLQAVLGVDTFQDVATIEIERDSRNNVTVQVVGDIYMYGPNYIYQPVYVAQPILFDVFWVSNYRPYYSPWYWGYYPRYYSYWAPCAPYRYHNHVNVYINTRNTYAYVNTRHSHRAGTIYGGRRSNAYERQHPNTGFSSRNRNVANRYDLEQSRGGRSGGSRGVASSSRNSSAPNNSRGGFQNSSRANNAGRTLSDNNVNRESNYRSGRSLNNGGSTPANNNSRGSNSQPSVPAGASRNNSTPGRSYENSTPRNNNSSNVRSNSNVSPVRNSAPAQINNAPAVRNTPAPRNEAPRMQNSAPSRQQSAPAMNSAPSRQQSAPSMNSAPARQQSAPAMQSGGSNRGGSNSGGGNRSGGGNGGGRSRG
jgi:hypothetical protein